MNMNHWTRLVRSNTVLHQIEIVGSQRLGSSCRNDMCTFQKEMAGYSENSDDNERMTVEMLGQTFRNYEPER